MIYYLYILYSAGYDRHYIGITDNPSRRITEHNRGIVPSTKPYRPYVILGTEGHADKHLARKREIFLKKTAKARKELFESLHNGAVV